jgi:thioredoxin reductase (NADPH)
VIDRLMLQIKPFEPVFHFEDLVNSMEPLQSTRGFKVTSKRGLCFEAKAVILANGVGAFLPRALNAPEQAQFLGKQLFHGQLETALSHFEASSPQKESQRWKVWIVGGENEAVLNALTGFKAFKHLDITLIHRRTPLEIDPPLQEAWQDALHQSLLAQHQDSKDVSPDSSSTLAFKHGQIVHLWGQSSKDNPDLIDQSPLRALEWVDEQGQMHTSEVDLVVVNLGLSPQLGALSEWGAQMQKKQITVNAEDFSTSLAGVFAIGDVIT